MAENPFDRRGLVYGGAAGIVAWVLGYVFSYLLVAPDVRERGLSRAIEALQGEPATYEMVGWVFYNAHLVETVFRNVPVIGTVSTSFVGGDDGFTPLLYVVPVALLVAAGLALARSRESSDTADGVVAALSVVPGYLLASVVGALLFVVRLGSASAGPDLLAAVVVAGVAYPVLCAGAGGALGAVTSDT